MLAEAEQAGQFRGAALLAKLAGLGRARMTEYLEYLRAADRVVDATLAGLDEPAAGGADLATLRTEVGQALADLHTALDALTR
jgi:hypothetical protein